MMLNNKNHRQSALMLCEACEIVPAAFLCKADSASLCAACDEDVHSANPLTSRHHRVPIASATAHEGNFMARKAEDNHDQELAVDDDEAASWLLLNPIIKSNNIDRKGLFGAEVEDYLELDDYDSSHVSNHIDINLRLQNDKQSVVVPQKSFDRVVPIERRLGLEYDSSNNNGYNKAYPDSAASSQSNPFWWNRKEAAAEESSSATEFSTISHSTRHPKGTIDLFLSTPTQVPAHQLSPMERKARVLRYREKKKTRKFEKTIRYASRKAYAEARPRIKGRFAKRRDAEADDEVADQQIVFLEKYSYGVVPSISSSPER